MREGMVMTQSNDPRFSRPQPMPYYQEEMPQGQGTVVMPRSPQAEPPTLVYRPNGGSSYPPPQAHQQMQQQMQQQGQPPGQYSQRPPIQPYAQYTPPAPQQQPQSYAPQQPQSYAPQQPQSYAPQQPQSYAPPPQQPPQMAYAPQQPQQPQVGFGFGGVSVGLPGVPNIPGMDAAFGKIKGPSGMPSALAFGFGIAAAVIALVFDVIFLNVDVPGIGGYAWYLSTALTFAAAGFAGAKFTKATRTTALTAIGVAGAIYGIADLGMGIVLEHMPMGDALFLGIQGVVIAIFTGSGGVYKGLRARG